MRTLPAYAETWTPAVMAGSAAAAASYLAIAPVVALDHETTAVGAEIVPPPSHEKVELSQNSAGRPMQLP